MSGSATIDIIGYPAFKLTFRTTGGNIRATILAACLLMLVGCASRQPGTLTVLTYNIHHGAGSDGKYDLQRVADVIRNSGSDLVALQEVDLNTGRTKTDQPQVLARMTGFHVYFGRAMDFGGGQYGDMILSRYPLQSAEVYALPFKDGGKREPRCLVIAQVKTPGGVVVFASTHLDHTGGAENDRLAQTNAIIDKIRKEKRPTIIAGDFNCTPASEPIEQMTQHWTDTTGDAPTCPADKPDKKIDYVFASPSLRMVEQEVIDDPVTSDHRPVRVKLEWK